MYTPFRHSSGIPMSVESKRGYRVELHQILQEICYKSSRFRTFSFISSSYKVFSRFSDHGQALYSFWMHQQEFKTRMQGIILAFATFVRQEVAYRIVSLIKQATFLSHRRQPEVCFFLFNLSSHHHIYIVQSLFTSRDHQFENLGKTTVLACEMFTSGCLPWLKNVACLSSLMARQDSSRKHSSYQKFLHL